MLRRDLLKLALLSGAPLSLLRAAPALAQETPRRGGTLTVAMQNDAKSLDPTFQINFGMMEKAKARRSIELFARHVMPHFR